MRAFALLAVVLSSLVAASAHASDFWDEVKDPGLRRFHHEVDEGWDALRNRRYEDASKAADRAVSTMPARCEGYLLRARAWAELGRLEDAADALERALERDRACADDPEHGAPAAEAAAAAGHYELAARVVRRVVGRMSDGPQRRMLYDLYGDMLLTLGPDHVHDAILAYREVLRHRVDVRASLGLALALRRAGRTREATEVARDAVAHGRVDALVARLPIPASEKAARLAVALDAVGDVQGARRAWQQASEGAVWREQAERELARARSRRGEGAR